MINVDKLAKNYGSKMVHSDVTFSVQHGECLGLLGGSGAGKSVILRSLIGLENIDSGEIQIDGLSVKDYTERDWVEIRKKVAYVFQYGALFDSMSVYENLAYPLREHTPLTENQIQEHILRTLTEFNLDGIENNLPSELSGGMQKRVGLARAIILSPKVILYDEPTAGLDPANTIKIQELIRKMKTRGTTSILVTHDMETAIAVCDRVCLLHNGEIQASGRVQDIKSDPQSFLQKFIRGQYE